MKNIVICKKKLRYKRRNR